MERGSIVAAGGPSNVECPWQLSYHSRAMVRTIITMHAIVREATGGCLVVTPTTRALTRKDDDGQIFQRTRTFRLETVCTY